MSTDPFDYTDPEAENAESVRPAANDSTPGLTRCAPARERMGLTQIQLSVRSDVSPSTISRFEGARTLEELGSFRLSTVFALAKALGVEVRYLLKEEALR